MLYRWRSRPAVATCTSLTTSPSCTGGRGSWMVHRRMRSGTWSACDCGARVWGGPYQRVSTKNGQMHLLRMVPRRGTWSRCPGTPFPSANTRTRNGAWLQGLGQRGYSLRLAMVLGFQSPPSQVSHLSGHHGVQVQRKIGGWKV